MEQLSFKGHIKKKLNQTPGSDGVKETRENDDQTKCCWGKMSFYQSNKLILTCDLLVVGKVIVNLFQYVFCIATSVLSTLYPALYGVLLSNYTSLLQILIFFFLLWILILKTRGELKHIEIVFMSKKLIFQSFYPRLYSFQISTQFK